MIGEYQTDRQWSDKYIPLIKQIVGPHLLCESPLEVDRKQAADLITLKARDLTIACRVRRAGFVARYGWQFTMRSNRSNGAETELRKIVNGWGDWMFYAHAAPGNEVAFARWLLIDLAAWRAQMLRDSYSKERRLIWQNDKPNADGRTSFAWFDVRSFTDDPPLLVASSEPVPIIQKAVAA